MATIESDSQFDIVKVSQLFQSCKLEDGTIQMDEYVDSFDELCKLFKALGSVFGFVTSDVVEKVGILRDYRKSDEGEKYASIQGMIQYEVDTNTTDNKKKASGSRTLLRLHRALEFIIELLRKILIVKEGDKLAGVAREAYDSTLSKHHPWFIRKAVHVALYALPKKKQLLERMQKYDLAKTEEHMAEAIRDGAIVFDIVQDLYEKNNLCGLP